MIPRVLYIAGTGRSGSTLLASILGGVQGFFAAGEVRFLWQRGLLQNRLCGCGRRFRDCPVWGAILAQAFGDDIPDPADMVRQQQSLTRIRHLPRLWLSSHLEPASLQYQKDMACVYRAISEVTGSGVLIDSSKLPSYGRVLDLAGSIDLRVLHLVRDPRAAAYSWGRRKEQPDRGPMGYMERIGPLKSSLLWTLWNASTQHFWGKRSEGYWRLRYEDFIAEPRRTVEKIVAWVDVPGKAVPFLADRTVVLKGNHTVAGNPDRLRQGPTVIRSDGEWASAMGGRERLIVTTVTLPLRRQYGYGWSRESVEDHHMRVQELPAPRRLGRRIHRHWQWLRQQGLRRLIEEDQLNPLERLAGATSRWVWRRRHPLARGASMPIFLVGLQRSGTNMLARALETSPEFEVHNENDSRAFDRFRLKPDLVIRNLVASSAHRYILFKPLIDSHRINGLLDQLATPTPGRALWVYRSVEGRTRSALAKFGDNNLWVLRAIAAGRTDGLWQAEHLPASVLEVIASYDWERMTAASAAAMLWYARNSLVFELGLNTRKDVLLVSYDRLLRAPGSELRRVCQFLGLDYRAAMIGTIEPDRGGHPLPMAIEPAIGALCARLTQRLDEVAAQIG